MILKYQDPTTFLVETISPTILKVSIEGIPKEFFVGIGEKGELGRQFTCISEYKKELNINSTHILAYSGHKTLYGAFNEACNQLRALQEEQLAIHASFNNLLDRCRLPL